MSETVELPSREQVRGEWKYIVAAAAVTLPALLAKLGAIHPRVEVETILFGAAILGAAFLLSWGAEVAQLDISQALAIAFLAFIAVLPEYAVDLVFSWKAGAQDAGGAADLCGATERCRELAIANMTGANRLLIGLGWATVVLIWVWKSGQKQVVLGSGRRTELGFLLLATLWALTIPPRGHVSLLDLAVLGTLFVAYVWRAAREEAEPPELVGPPLALAVLSTRARRTWTAAMFVFAASVILVAAEPFAEGLVEIGERFEISSFLLVQWLAPLASEAPEMIIAILFVLRMKPAAGLGALVSSKVNQWTLLVGTIPVVYAISRGAASPLEFGERQVEEVFLTAAQSLFAVGVLANLSISRAEALGMLVLFAAQFGFESTAVRYGFSVVYLGLFLMIVVGRADARRGLAAALRDALQLPWRAATGDRSGDSRV